MPHCRNDLNSQKSKEQVRHILKIMSLQFGVEIMTKLLLELWDLTSCIVPAESFLSYIRCCNRGKWSWEIIWEVILLLINMPDWKPNGKIIKRYVDSVCFSAFKYILPNKVLQFNVDFFIIVYSRQYNGN